jgi:predicted dehydrogenase
MIVLPGRNKMSECIRVGLVGCGNISGAHLRAYRELPTQFEVVALCDVVEEKAQKKAEEFGVPGVTTCYEDLLENPSIDLIDITTPPYLHEDFSIRAVWAGKLAQCEKPAGGSLAEVDAMIDAERRTGKWILPVFNYRFGFGLQRLLHLQRLGVTGKLYLSTVETHWRRPADYFNIRWRAGWRTALGGAFIGHSIHAHDALYQVAGAVKSVFAHAGVLVNPIEVEDTLAVSARMENGSLAALSVTFGSAVEISRHRYCFEHLVAESNTSPYAGHTSDPWQFLGATPQDNLRIQEALAEFKPEPPEGFTGQFLRTYQAVREGSSPPITLIDARRAIELTTAVYYSVFTNQVVELPIEKDHPYYQSCIPADAKPLESWLGEDGVSSWKPVGV